jgi:DNA-binding NtrC family response regulator
MKKQTNNILIVEDRDDWQDILYTILAQQGYSPHPTASYLEAVAALESNQFNIAVVDPVLDMANRFNRDGLSVIQKIRETYPTMPVIVLTGSLTHDMEVTLDHLSPNSPVLFKDSWDARAFNQLIEELIGRQQPETTGPAKQPAGEAVSTPLEPPPAEKGAGRPRVLLVENRLARGRQR